ncbi:hypothetical protein DV737_g5013, partial [Chaetothyriales sp. CBS 132003]
MDGVQTISPILLPSLLDLLSNSIIFASLLHYLPLSSIFRLSRTSHSFRHLLLSTPDTFRYVDLSKSKGAYMPLIQMIDRGGHSWRAERMDESFLTEDEFYARPLRGVLGALHRMQILTNVQTLVLDGLASVTNDLLSDIVTSQDYSVRLLSIRRCVNVNHPKLQQLLAYICRPSRPEDTPRLRGLYVFTDPIPQLPSIDDIGVTVAEGSQMSASCGDKDSPISRLESWYAANGRMLSNGHKQRSEWEETLQICRGIVWFDAVPCTHMHAAMSSVLHHHPEQHELNEKPGVSTIATIALGPNGCAGCRRAPEGTPIWGKSDISDFPLLWPPPHSGKLIDAIRPPVRYDRSTEEFSQRLIVARDNQSSPENVGIAEGCAPTAQLSLLDPAHDADAGRSRHRTFPNNNNFHTAFLAASLWDNYSAFPAEHEAPARREHNSSTPALALRQTPSNDGPQRQTHASPIDANEIIDLTGDDDEINAPSGHRDVPLSLQGSGTAYTSRPRPGFAPTMYSLRNPSSDLADDDGARLYNNALPPLPPHVRSTSGHGHGRYASVDSSSHLSQPNFITRPRMSSMAEGAAYPSLPAHFGVRQPPESVERQHINEEDICPVCHRALPERGSNGDETAREAHIMACINARDPDSSSDVGSSSRGTLHMISFTASEKDCVAGDGNVQECSICMEEYDVGDELARLECWCKFHKHCIMSWLNKKAECPVHKTAAIHFAQD